MRRYFFLPLIVLVVMGSAAAFHGQQPSKLNPVELVNPLIGTTAEGQTYPGAGVPFGMTQWTPQTRAGEQKCIAPYYATDTRIQGFRGSHFLTGSCTQDYGSVTLMPMASDEHLDAAGRASVFSHAGEVAKAYKYSVDLTDSDIHAEVTGTQRSGMMRFRYRAGQGTGWMAVENNVRKGSGSIRIDAARQEITGENPVYRIYAGNGLPAGFSGYFVIQFSGRFTVGGSWDGAKRNEKAAESSGSAPGAYVSFDLKSSREVLVRIGTSFVSVEEARRNLAGEIPGWSFDLVAEQARVAWNSALLRIEVAGNSPDRRIFYTALFHAMQLPRTFSDRSGTYPRFAGGKAVEHANGFTYYCDFSIWDTFRAVHPLLTILDPARERDMVQSLIAKGEQGGYLPIFPAWNSYTSEMVGDHANAVIADAYVKGIRGFDVESAYRLMRRNATEIPADHAAYIDGRGRRALPSYLKCGYIPLEDHISDAFHSNEQVSRTLEYAYDDFLVSNMAKALGHAEDAALFAKHAQNYRNVIDPETGFARGRHADGSWDTPFDPTKPYPYITEGLPYQYTFFVLQDIPGLIDVVHGREAFVQKLDRLFDGGFYNHGNEPSHHIAYLYNYAGEPAKTQRRVHDIMQKEYRDTLDGLTGNDDAGQMSAWYVMSAMGIYAVTPGTPEYAIGTPHFDSMTVRLQAGKTLHIRAAGAESGKFYVRSVTLNGRKLERPFLTHKDLVGGGELVFAMSSEPPPVQ